MVLRVGWLALGRSAGAKLLVLGEEGGVELLEAAERLLQLLLGREEGGAEVEGARLLQEPGPGHAADPRLLQQRQAVEQVGRLARRLRRRNGLWGQHDLREGVHGALRVLARHPRDGAELGVQHLGLRLERVVDAGGLAREEVVAGLARLGGVHHQLRHDLAVQVGAEAHAAVLEDLRHHRGVEAAELHVPAAAAALPDEPLGGGVEGGELHAGVVVPEVAHRLLHGDELLALGVDVLLVHLVREQHEALLLAQLDDVGEVGLGHELPGGVPRVDDAERLGLEAVAARLVDHLARGVDVEAPALLLLEVVAELLAAEDGDEGGVEGVLGDGDEHRVLGAADEGGEHLLDAGAGAAGEVEALGVAGVAVALLNEGGDAVAEGLDALAVAVGTGAALDERL
mmetsp:Transcript_27798/g.60802  ORF Transcript_27798/g.60802 Transcript_27798/m.60802 type:complete len:399 (+) Transcript_27798:298-1494(+)